MSREDATQGFMERKSMGLVIREEASSAGRQSLLVCLMDSLCLHQSHLFCV